MKARTPESQATRAGAAGYVPSRLSEETLLATMVSTSLASVQLARALVRRSFHEPFWPTGLRGNRVLVGSTGGRPRSLRPTSSLRLAFA